MSSPEFRRRQRKAERRNQQAKETEMKYYDVEYIKSVLALHPWECVFELDAPRKITERLSHRTMDEWLGLNPIKKLPNRPWVSPHILAAQEYEQRRKIHEEFKNAFHQSEIYCPHEGIDRTAEVGVRLDWS